MDYLPLCSLQFLMVQFIWENSVAWVKGFPLQNFCFCLCQGPSGTICLTPIVMLISQWSLDSCKYHKFET